MKQYWDTSAVINALVSASVWRRLDSGQHVTRLHTFYEFFSTITGRGIKVTDESQDSIHSVAVGCGGLASQLRNARADCRFGFGPDFEGPGPS